MTDKPFEELKCTAAPDGCVSGDALAETGAERPAEGAAPAHVGRTAAGQFAAGNLAHLGHGAARFQRTGLLPAEVAAEIGAELDQLVSQYVADLGGDDAMTTGRRQLLELLRTTSGMRLLVERDLAERGWRSARGRVRSTVTLLLSLIDREERLVKHLGIERNARKVDALGDYLRQRGEQA